MPRRLGAGFRPRRHRRPSRAGPGLRLRRHRMPPQFDTGPGPRRHRTAPRVDTGPGPRRDAIARRLGSTQVLDSVAIARRLGSTQVLGSVAITRCVGSTQVPGHDVTPSPVVMSDRSRTVMKPRAPCQLRHAVLTKWQEPRAVARGDAGLCIQRLPEARCLESGWWFAASVEEARRDMSQEVDLGSRPGRATRCRRCPRSAEHLGRTSVAVMRTGPARGAAMPWSPVASTSDRVHQEPPSEVSW